MPVKIFSSIRLRLLSGAIALLLTACGEGSYWEGEPTGASEIMAKKVCECMAGHLKEHGVDLDLIASVDPKVETEEMANLGRAAWRDKNPALAEALDSLEYNINDAPCLKGLEEEMEAREIQKRDVKNALRKNCKFLRIK